MLAILKFCGKAASRCATVRAKTKSEGNYVTQQL
jgi:hypothetical protein